MYFIWFGFLSLIRGKILETCDLSVIFVFLALGLPPDRWLAIPFLPLVILVSFGLVSFLGWGLADFFNRLNHDIPETRRY